MSYMFAGQFETRGVGGQSGIEVLRNWASARCLDAAKPGIYQHRQKSPQHLPPKSWRNHGTSHGDGALMPLG